MRIDLELPPNERDRQQLVDALLKHSRRKYGDPTARPVGFFLRDEEGNLCGGLTGNLRWSWLYVEVLWVRRDLRGQGYGSRLLQGAEVFAEASGGVAVHLDTDGDETLAYYRKRGYEVFGTLEGFPPGARQHFLRKWLRSP